MFPIAQAQKSQTREKSAGLCCCSVHSSVAAQIIFNCSSFCRLPTSDCVLLPGSQLARDLKWGLVWDELTLHVDSQSKVVLWSILCAVSFLKVPPLSKCDNDDLSVFVAHSSVQIVTTSSGLLSG